MNIRAVIFGFFVILAATLNIAFVIGDIDDPTLHAPYELFAAVVVNLVATGLKISDRTHVGAMHLATSLVADLQLLTAALVWIYAVYIVGDGYTPGAATIMVSMAAGALLANLVSVWLLRGRDCVLHHSVAQPTDPVRRHVGDRAARRPAT